MRDSKKIRALMILTLFFMIIGCGGTMHYKVGETRPEREFKPHQPIIHKQQVSVIQSNGKIKKKIDPVQEAYKYYILASLALSEGRIHKAKEWLLTAIKNDPNSIYLHKKMVIILKHTKDYKDAIPHIKKCIELDPHNLSYRIMLGDLYGITHQYELAIKEYKEVLKRNPGNEKVRLLLSDILIREGRYREALKQLNKLLKEDNDLGIAYYYRGRVNMQL
ncbi:MAG: hypothetical protein DRG39_05840, partial [Deltaproteobacteria bacterium]